MARKAPYRISCVEAKQALDEAEKNWKDWLTAYKHTGDVAMNPLLVDRWCFGCSFWEYGVDRTVGYHEGHGA